MFEFSVEGLVEGIKEQAAKLGDALGEDALREIGYAGAEVFRDEAKRNAQAHVQTGTIHKNIIIKRLEEDSEGDTKQVYLITVRQGRPGGSDAFYWRFVEDGHKFVRRRKSKRDTISRRRAEALESGGDGVPAYPFMRPAYESKKAEVATLMQAKLDEIIKKAIG